MRNSPLNFIADVAHSAAISKRGLLAIRRFILGPLSALCGPPGLLNALPKRGVKSRLQRIYVAAMMRIVAGGLVATSRVDARARREFAGYPVGFQVQLLVLPAGPGFVIESNGDGSFQRAHVPKVRPDLNIQFKHLGHAFLVFSFQEGTARALAFDRMIIDGDLGLATRLVRCLNRMEVLILPKLVAQRAVKRYPEELALREKLPVALRVYGRLMGQFMTGR